MILVTPLCGCVTRYARVIALSSPPLCDVTDQRTGVSYGLTPAYIDVQRRFFVLQPQKRQITYIFDHSGYKSSQKAVTIAKWARTKAEGPSAVTSIHGTLSNCDCTEPAPH
jgi:hypothetical protein